MPTSTKPEAEIMELNKVNGCNDILFCDHSILEGDRIPPLKSHGQALEEELCFPGVLSDNRDAPANIIIIERKDLGGLMSKDCKDTLQTLKQCQNASATQSENRVSVRCDHRQSCRDQENFG